tara:strand:+ start:1339 stop:4782 length:3444 start_codon:yes stop_codon:yes gene_type:complete
MNYEGNNLQPNNLNVVNNIRVMRYLTQRNKQILLDWIGVANWRDARDLLGYNRRWGERRVLREMKTEYNREQQGGAVRNLVGGIMNRVVDRQTQERLQGIAIGLTARRIQRRVLQNKIDRVKRGERLTFDTKRLSGIINGLDDDKYLIRIGEQTYALNQITRARLLDSFRNGVLVEELASQGSDTELAHNIQYYDSFTIERIEQRGMALPEGAFFQYTHNIQGLDLSKLQIYTEDTYDTKTVNDENCFYCALKHSELVEDSVLNTIKENVKSRLIPQKSIKKLAESYNLYITVRKPNSHKTYSYGKKTENEIKLILIDNHYLLLCRVPITKWALENGSEHHDWYREGKRDTTKYIDSYNLITYLLKNKERFLKPLTSEILNSTIYNDKSKEIQDISFIEENLKLYEPRKTYERKNKNDKGYDIQKDIEYVNVFFDFETDTFGNVHKPYLCRCSNIDKQYLGEECGKHMLYDLVKRYPNKGLRLIAHNAGYDIRFIFKYLHRVSLIERGRSLLRGKAFFFETPVIIQDSYAHIPMKLAGFGKTFGLDCEKEVIPYCLYSKKNIKERYLPIKKCLDGVRYQHSVNTIGKTKSSADSLINLYLENADRWGCIKGDTIDIVNYSDQYCKMDCEVLEKGYETFKYWIGDITGLDIDDYCSLPSIANDAMGECFQGVYQLSAIPRQFVQMAMIGGRTMCAENKKWIVEGKQIDDFDAVSLYPSAMNRLGGYLKGKPKILTNLTYKFLEKQDGYFVEIEIKSVGIHRKFPLMSIVNDKGVRMFNNEMIGEKIVVDKITLEDLIKFQAVKFEVIRGYYYNEGRNTELAPTIKGFFDERVAKKKEGNPIQNVYKLLMNSAYGKTLLKPFDTEIKYMSKKEADKFVDRHYNHIREITEVNDYITSVDIYKPISNHFNNAPCGVEVLSMSKRIMNEVICLAEDLGLNIYYQDTDSLHIDTDQIKTLSEEYTKLYGRTLIGSGMGQFHSDFESGILKGDMNEVICLAKDLGLNIHYQDKDILQIDTNQIKTLSDEYTKIYGRTLIGSTWFNIDFDSGKINGLIIHATKSLFLGKKCYIDRLEDGTGALDYHIRMKGCSNASILHFCKKNNLTPEQLYEKLYKGDAVKLDQTCDGMAIKFEYNKKFEVYTKLDFSRTIKF